MYLIDRLGAIARRILLERGGARIKEHIWNREFSGGRWTCLEDTVGDCVYQFVEKYCNGGSILDLGCGSGNTGVELDGTRYDVYTGIDISRVAIRTAMDRARSAGRIDKNKYFQSDIVEYTPTRRHNVILFRDSIYYVPLDTVKPMLDRYAAYLQHDGVFVTRMFDREKGKQYVDLIERHYILVEQYCPTTTKTSILVFR